MARRQLSRDVLVAALELPILRIAGPRGAADAAVVLPVRLHPAPTVTMVLRAGNLREHAGEVGFPGGKVEPADTSLEAAALRELDEEIGIAAAHVEVLGSLSATPVITARYLIHPIVALVREGPAPRVASPEVERILDVPLLPWILGHEPIRGVRVTWRGDRTVAPHFCLDRCVLYGASAYIFHELLIKIGAALGVELPAPVLDADPPWRGRYRLG